MDASSPDAAPARHVRPARNRPPGGRRGQRGRGAVAGLAVLVIAVGVRFAGQAEGNPVVAPSSSGDVDGPGPGSPVPPLTDEARTALAATPDDRDRLGEAWYLLADALEAGDRSGEQAPRSAGDAAGHRAGGAEATAGDWPVPLDVAGVLADPDAWRGRAVRLVGRLEQRSRIPDTDPPAEEWFVRAVGGPVAVVIRSPPSIASGRRVVVIGRVLDRLRVVDRRGVAMRYPRMVAASDAVRADVPVSPGVGLGPGGATLVGLVAVLGVGLVLARHAVRRVRAEPAIGAAPDAADHRAARDRSERRARTNPEPADDPAAALAELRRSAEARDVADAGADGGEPPRGG